MSNKEKLPQERIKGLLKILQTRFEKNMGAIKDLNGRKYKQSWKLISKNYGR